VVARAPKVVGELLYVPRAIAVGLDVAGEAPDGEGGGEGLSTHTEGKGIVPGDARRSVVPRAARGPGDSFNRMAGHIRRSFVRVLVLEGRARISTLLKPMKAYSMSVGTIHDPSPFGLVREIFIERKPAGFDFAGDHERSTEEETRRRDVDARDDGRFIGSRRRQSSTQMSRIERMHAEEACPWRVLTPWILPLCPFVSIAALCQS
jgi:hypothetical protein